MPKILTKNDILFNSHIKKDFLNGKISILAKSESDAEELIKIFIQIGVKYWSDGDKLNTLKTYWFLSQGKYGYKILDLNHGLCFSHDAYYEEKYEYCNNINTTYNNLGI